jgi:hypothetical protein
MDQVLAQAVGADKSVEDSFERFYNKDLDLDEGKSWPSPFLHPINLMK